MISSQSTRDHPAAYYAIAGFTLLNAAMLASIFSYKAKNNQYEITKVSQTTISAPLLIKRKETSAKDVVGTGDILSTVQTMNSLETLVQTSPDSQLSLPEQDIHLPEINVATANPTPAVVQPAWQNPNTNDPTFTSDNDETLLARMLYGEVAGRSLNEMYAVAYVALTRVERHIRGNTLREVILAPAQFSAFNNLEQVMHPIRDDTDPTTRETIPNTYDVRVWNRCLTTARAVLDSTAINPAPNSDHYIHVDTTQEPVGGRRVLTDGNLEPDWALEYEPVNAGIETEGTALIQFFNSQGQR